MALPPLGIERRRLMKGALAGAATTILPRVGLTQSNPTVLGARRHALVIGNSRYRSSPLKNPVNDARAIAVELRAADFSIDLVLDASIATMRARIEAFGGEIARTKSVGLFYFAGHGVQLSWHNYLLPIDTELTSIDEVPDKTVDLGRILEMVGRANNPANIIILDACRNNPFGRDFRVERKGLSQIDAPVSTLLAYATAPGHVAIDGEGANGLYTAHLLTEMRVPDTRIEDIFKRVRLNVRRESRGLQIPWESTSLEADFYFQLPEQLRKAAAMERQRWLEAEREAIRKEEERQWQLEFERQARARAEAERQRLLEEELRLKKIAEDELRARLDAEKAANRIAEIELLRKEEELLEAQRQAAAESRRKEEEARETKRLADAEHRRKLEAEREAMRRNEAEQKRLFDEERALWERTKDLKDLAAFEDFAYRYPSGNFVELAYVQIDLLRARLGEKKIAIVDAGGNPYSKGTGRLDTDWKIGDSYTYEYSDLLTRVVRDRRTWVITAVTDTEVTFENANAITVRDRLGTVLRSRLGRFSSRQIFVSEYSVGHKWSCRYTVDSPSGVRREVGGEFRVIAREKITVIAGTFDCFHVAGRLSSLTRNVLRWERYTDIPTTLVVNYWIAPSEVRRYLRWEYREQHRDGSYFTTNREELVAYKQS